MDAILQLCPPQKKNKKTMKELNSYTWKTEEGVGRQHLGMDRLGVCQVPEGNGEQKNRGNWL